MRLLWALVLLGVSCTAPPAEPTCDAYCTNLRRCGDSTPERVCLWACLAGVEHRRDKGRRCSRRHREELACLAEVDDCDFLLGATDYDGAPCAGKGRARAGACNESGVPAEDLVPLSSPIDP